MQLYSFSDKLISLFGLKAKDSVYTILFHDIDQFNISTLLIQLVKTIVIKRDQTVIDLTSNSTNPLEKFMKVGTVF